MCVSPFTWTPQKWVEPGFNPLYTFHMRTSNRVQPAFYTQVQPASEVVHGKLGKHGCRCDVKWPPIIPRFIQYDVLREER